ncbi:MAG: phosphotransferase family protein [Arcobacter sp.]|nr:phosphotransferase family protein [Arcobacter sp.]
MILKKLKNQGYCNTNYILKLKNKSYLFRVFKESDYYKIDRKKEFKIQKKASKKNLAPKPILLEKDFMLSHFIKGFHKKNLNKKDIKTISKNLKKLHSMKSDIEKYDIKKDLAYYKSLENKNINNLVKNIEKQYKKLKKYKEELVLCHNDLNSKNIIFSKKYIKFIDWEYAFLNDRFFDLASICVEFDLKEKEEKLFLKSYLKNIKKYYLKKLKYYKIIYKNLAKLWFENKNIFDTIPK